LIGKKTGTRLEGRRLGRGGAELTVNAEAKCPNSGHKIKSKPPP
jgi:hypothetical protein